MQQLPTPLSEHGTPGDSRKQAAGILQQKVICQNNRKGMFLTITTQLMIQN